jgi:uncharacterized protein GlcG (DUF336 family)
MFVLHWSRHHACRLDEARRASEGVCKKAEKIDTKMCIPVVDSGGKLKDFMRMDEAWIGSIDVAIRKAKTPHLC